ncbi:hypothetical protein BDFB_010163 [Asbolus verrucosus]|uniref:Uncharacterized protein n=1 Tax=Asbolus verrucosus TaxID=1661398 RepID=A0A482W5J8_ASBVE|nr:hypothetical protein BDFB_010163 [Asbolus verrucosus]
MQENQRPSPRRTSNKNFVHRFRIKNFSG